jgi:hypothetical protein
MFPHPYMAEKVAAEHRRELLRPRRPPPWRQPGHSAMASWCARRLRQIVNSVIRLGRRFGDSARTAGWPRLEPVHLDVDLRNQTARRADAEGVSQAEITRRALRLYVRAAWAPGSPAPWHTEPTHAYVVQGVAAAGAFQLIRRPATAGYLSPDARRVTPRETVLPAARPRASGQLPRDPGQAGRRRPGEGR